MKKYIFLIILIMAACSSPQDKKTGESATALISNAVIASAMDAVKSVSPEVNQILLEKGVKQAASLWRSEDGTPDEFREFVVNNFISDPEKRKVVFRKISNYFESLNGNFNEITIDLKKVLDEAAGEIDEIDRMFGNYSVNSHLSDDFYANRIAFFVALNFPYYTLEEKENLGPGWSREEWAMARMGDLFVSRVPAQLNQKLAAAAGNADMYIADYNIFMGRLRTEEGKQLFPDDMILLSHWNLRDELKADYADRINGPAKQEMIYSVMERIIKQEIPEVVINNPEYEWLPYSNRIMKNGQPAEARSEPDTRYAHILDNFRAMKETDIYYPEGMNTAILRKFSVEMEISQEEVESLFDSYLSSPLLAQLGKIVKERLGRDLKPYDIWYTGFKTQSNISEELLTAKTSKLYPDPSSFRSQMPEMLRKLGWSPQRAQYLADKIVVDPARGSGHAWGAAMRGSVSHLRTRIPEKGMDYKGYNIAVHEFGHNIEQTISLYDVDYYMMSGVPNTAVTEALAFIFQSRNLDLLGMKDNNPEKDKLDTFDAAWSLMEIMGVGMVDMKTWKWLYQNPNATPAELKNSVVNIALETWNRYFAPVTGIKDSPILAVYSHMVNSPLYLANYSYGQIIEFQLEEFLKGRKLANEIDRIYKQGRLTPQQWMTGAVGQKISAQPVLNALESALN